MALRSTRARGLMHGLAEENVFMQPSGDRPDHKAFWVKKAAAQDMCCKGDAMVPLDLFFGAYQHAKIVFFLLCGFQSAVSNYVDTAGWNISAALDVQRVKSNHSHVVHSRHITLHSHLNKSSHHILEYSSLFIFNNSVHTNMSVPTAR